MRNSEGERDDGKCWEVGIWDVIADWCAELLEASSVGGGGTSDAVAALIVDICNCDRTSKSVHHTRLSMFSQCIPSLFLTGIWLSYVVR